VQLHNNADYAATTSGGKLPYSAMPVQYMLWLCAIRLYQWTVGLVGWGLMALSAQKRPCRDCKEYLLFTANISFS